MLFPSILAEIRNNEPEYLFTEPGVADQNVYTDWAPIKVDWAPVKVDWAPVKLDWAPVKVDWAPNKAGRGGSRPSLSAADLPEVLRADLAADAEPGNHADSPEQRAATDAVWKGVECLLDDYVAVRDDDVVLVAYTTDSRTAAAWILAELRTRGTESRSIAMRPLVDEELPGRLDKLLPSAQELKGRLVIITVERNTMSHVDVFRQAMLSYHPGQWYVGRIIGASPEFFTHAMREARQRISARNTALLERFMKARRMRITTPGGSDLSVVLDSERFQWTSNRGSARPGGFVVLPPGEVATYPQSVDGVFVADGAINVNLSTRLDARLSANPIEVVIRGGRAVDFSCENPEVSDFIEACFSIPNMVRIGELGFGTNSGIPEFIPMNTHINERRPGVHLGFGGHNQMLGLVDYQVELHMDLISDGATVWLDDDPAPLDLRNAPLSDADHPTGVVDEDIDGDCCELRFDQINAEETLGG